MTEPETYVGGGGARTTLAAIAAVALACALGWSSGFLNPVSLALATLATAATIGAVLLGRRGSGPPAVARPTRTARIVLGAGLALSLAYDAVVPPGFYVPPGTLGAIRPLLALTALLCATWVWARRPPALAALRFPLLLALAAAMGGIVIRRAPQPAIDVWYFQQMGADALLQGLDPYLIAYPNIYGPYTAHYAPAVLSPDRLLVLGNPYPPLSILLAVPAAAVSADVRWVSLALVILSAWAIRRLGRGTIEGELAAVLFLFQPRTLFVVEQSWTEPALLAAVLGTALLVDRWIGEEASGSRRARTWIACGIVAGLALASKQYAPLLLLPVLFALPEVGRWKAAAVAAGVVLAVIVPFVAWDPQAFYRAVVEFQVAQPFRGDGLSWLAASVSLGGPLLPVWPAFLLAGAALALGIRRSVPLAQAVLTGAGAWLALVLFNKQAFCNYYWLAVGLLCAGAALSAGPADRRATGVSSG
jgi:hypothetical protein